jgi:hypothetical protein
LQAVGVIKLLTGGYLHVSGMKSTFFKKKLMVMAILKLKVRGDFKSK